MISALAMLLINSALDAPEHLQAIVLIKAMKPILIVVKVIEVAQWWHCN